MKHFLLISTCLLTLSGCGYFVPQSKPVIPKRMPEKLPDVDKHPEAFNGTDFLQQISTSGLHPDVVASRYIGKTYRLRFTVLEWMRNGEAVGLGGLYNELDYFFCVPVEKGTRLGDTVEVTAILRYYFHGKPDRVVWVFK